MPLGQSRSACHHARAIGRLAGVQCILAKHPCLDKLLEGSTLGLYPTSLTPSPTHFSPQSANGLETKPKPTPTHHALCMQPNPLICFPKPNQTKLNQMEKSNQTTPAQCSHQPGPGGIPTKIQKMAALGKLKPDYLPSICQPTSRRRREHSM
jgi:hypothetical protein